MNNEVKGTVDKLQTTVGWDEDMHRLVTTLKISVTGLTPEQLRLLFEFQAAGALDFSIASKQSSLFPLTEAAGSTAGR
jgi:hypothetical protein